MLTLEWAMSGHRQLEEISTCTLAMPETLGKETEG